MGASLDVSLSMPKGDGGGRRVFPVAMSHQNQAHAPGLLLAPYPADFPPLDAEIDAAVRQRVHAIPIFKSLGLSGILLGKGCLECTVARNPEHDGIFDSFHGGMLMTAADSAAAIACLTVWGAQSRITTTDMNIRFLAPARSDVRLLAQAIKQGRTLIPVAVNFWRDDGTLVAVAQVTYMQLT